jgi:hypothetical protein
MARNREHALKQIRAMFDMAAAAQKPDSPTTKDEAAVALANAGRLMAQWEIEADEVGTPGDARAAERAQIGELWFAVGNMDNCGAQRRSAVNLLCSTLGATCVYHNVKNATGSGIYGFRMHIFGAANTIAFLEMLLPSFMSQLTFHLERDTRAHRTALRAEGWYETKEINQLVAVYRRTYVTAFADMVAIKISRFRTEVIDGAKGEGTTALVLKSDSDRAEEAKKAAYSKIRSNKAQFRGVSAEGLRDGRRAGAEALVGQTETTARTERAALG